MWIELIDTPLGKLSAVLDNTCLCSIYFDEVMKGPLEIKPMKGFLGGELEKQLKAYFSGALKEFDLPLMLEGTIFQKRVWETLKTIPYGETLSYKSFAERAGYPLAARAVGNANGANRFPLILPCHRVIASGGGIGGYSCGIEKKRWLLEHEEKHARG